jgi:hypothetical protein
LRALLANTGFEEVTLASIVRDRAVLVCRKGTSTVPPTVHDYVAAIAFVSAPRETLRPGENVTFNLRVTNSGHARWPAAGALETKGIVRLGAHLLGADEEELQWDCGRAILPRDLAPGETADLEFVFRAPPKPGHYIVEFDMVAEHVTWFEDFGAGVLRHSFSVA